jgi:hypothetical protein
MSWHGCYNTSGTDIIYTDLLQTGRSGDWIPVGVRFFAPVRTRPGAPSASCAMDNGSLFHVDHPSPSSAKVKEYSYTSVFHLGLFMACLRVNFTFCTATSYILLVYHSFPPLPVWYFYLHYTILYHCPWMLCSLLYFIFPNSHQSQLFCFFFSSRFDFTLYNKIALPPPKKNELACVSVLAVYVISDVIVLIASYFKGIVFSSVILLPVNRDECPIFLVPVHQVCSSTHVMSL